MVSHPTFDTNLLDEIGQSLLTDENSPLLNRATQGVYPIPPEIDALINQPLSTEIRLPLATSEEGYISPLDMALIAAALSNNGESPALRLALAVDTPQSEWVILPALSEANELFSPKEASQLVTTFSGGDEVYWQIISSQKDEENLTWLLAGTPSDWSGTPLALVVLLEENNPVLAEEIARNLLLGAP